MSDKIQSILEHMLDDAVDDLANNGGFEYLGKDENGIAKFGDVPVKPYDNS